jgi:phosphoribosyl 1,2-cyclic phosphodiesterase
LTTGNTSILIDAGLGIRVLKRTLKNFDIDIDQIDAVFVTHDHADHIKAVGNLANEYGKLVYSTEKVHAGINSNYCMTSKLTETHIRIVQKDVTLQFGDMLITPFDVPHDSSDCVGYKIEAEGVVFCLITDAGHVTATMAEQVSKANYLVLEANHDEDMLMMGTYPAYLKGRIRGDRGHLCNRESAKLIAEHATPILKHVWLCHLSEENNHPELARKTVEGLLRSFGIIPGVDFELDILKRKSPSDLYELKP